MLLEGIGGVPPLRACLSNSGVSIMHMTISNKSVPCVHTGWTFWQREAFASFQLGKRTGRTNPMPETSRHEYTEDTLSGTDRTPARSPARSRGSRNGNM
jgi:hypothetical protein